MYKDLSLKEKAKVIREGVRLGLTSIGDIQNLYDEAVGHKFAEGSIANPDWDPNHPYHYHTANGEKVVITPEDWEKHKGQPYFKQVEDAVLAEQAAHPGPEYIINPQFSEALRRVYKGNMGPKYQNYISFSSNLPQGYSFTPEGLVSDNQGNLYVQKGFRQTPRFTYDENNPLVFPVLEGRNQGNVTFYPVNMEKTEKKPLPVNNKVEFPTRRINYINSGLVSLLYPELATLDNRQDQNRGIRAAKQLGFSRIIDNYEPGQYNGWLIGFTDDELNKFKKKLWDNNARDFANHGFKTIGFDGQYYNYDDWFNPATLTKQDESVIMNTLGWRNGPNGNQGYQTKYEIAPVLKPYIEVGPLQVNDVQTYAKGGPIVSPYGQWKYPGRDTIIPSNNITMNYIDYPVLGISDTGDTKVMMPWQDYKFKGSMVYEHPLIGNQFQLGGNTKPTFNQWYPTVPKQKNDTSSYDLRRAYNTLPFEELEKFRTINDYHLPSVAYDEKTDTYTFLKRNGHPTLNYELDWYNSGSPDAQEFRERYKLDTLSQPWKYIPNYAKGGSIHIDPKNKGKLTETMKRTGKSKYELAHSKNPLTRKRAQFAINASHWKHDNGGHLFQENGQIFKRPQDDLIGGNILTSPILPPKSYYEQFTIPELEPKKPQPLQPLEGTYGSKYSEIIPMSDGTYINNPINKGLQQDWRTHTLEFAPFLAIGAGPAIGSTTTWLASKPALYNLAKMTIGSEIGGRGVDLASNLFTGNTWGQNIGNIVEGVTGWNPRNTILGTLITDVMNPGYGLSGKGLANLYNQVKGVLDKAKNFRFNIVKPDNYYRVVGQDAIEDATKRGAVLGNPYKSNSEETRNMFDYIKDFQRQQKIDYIFSGKEPSINVNGREITFLDLPQKGVDFYELPITDKTKRRFERQVFPRLFNDPDRVEEMKLLYGDDVEAIKQQMIDDVFSQKQYMVKPKTYETLEFEEGRTAGMNIKDKGVLLKDVDGNIDYAEGHELRHTAQRVIPTTENEKKILSEAYNDVPNFYNHDYDMTKEWETMNFDARKAALGDVQGKQSIEIQNKVIEKMSNKQFVNKIYKSDGYWMHYIDDLIDKSGIEGPREFVLEELLKTPEFQQKIKTWKNAMMKVGAVSGVIAGVSNDKNKK